MEARVQFGDTELSYRVKFSARRKTVSIAVEPTGDIVLTAPDGVEDDRLNAVVKRRAPWILRQLSELQPPPPAREFVSGESFSYLGRQFRLFVVEGALQPKLKGGWLVVPIAANLTREQRPEAVRAAMIGWYQARAAARLPERVERWKAAAGGAPIGELILTEPRRRWGSCDVKGNLRFNWRLIQAPLAAVDYVVAHELVHLQHRDHSPAFWSALQAVQPDYRARRAALRELGPSMQW